MQPWAAISILVIMGVFLLVQLVIIHSFGAYARLLTKTHREVLDLRLNIALQQTDAAALAVLHRRRHDDPPLDEEREA